MSRIDNSFKSVTVGAFGLLLGYLLNFITRRIFVQYLSIEYLGLNGLFFNIFSLLSFAELGIGTAITYSMYRPLAFGETNKINLLVAFHRKVSYIVGIFFLITGLSITPFLQVLLKEAPDIQYLKLYYIVYIIDIGIGFFISYKRLLLYADQKRYIDNAYRYGFDLGRHTLQIIVLVMAHSYLLYLLVVLVLNIIENVLIHKKIDRIYPYLKKPAEGKLDKSDFTEIKKNVFGLMTNKLGNIVVNGTDNLLIVKFVDLASAGIYGGYYMLVVAITNVIYMFHTSILASIGNLVATESNEDHYADFKTLDFVIAWLVGFCAIALFTLINPFIQLWLGSEYTFPPMVVFFIILNFYLSGMLMSVKTFSQSMGLFWHNRYKPLFEASFNLIFSIGLAIKFGILGIFIGTTVSMILTSVWFEPFVLYRHGLQKSVISYYFMLIFNTAITVVFGWITWKVVGLITITHELLHFIVRVGVTAFLPNAMYLIIAFRRTEYKHVVRILSMALKPSE